MSEYPTLSRDIKHWWPLDELCISIEIITPRPNPKCVGIRKLIPREIADCLLPNAHPTMRLRREDYIKLLSEQIAAQLAVVLDTSDTISGKTPQYEGEEP